MSDAANMRKLMEAFKPTQQMEYDEYPTEDLPGNEMGDVIPGEVAGELPDETPASQAIIDALEGEFKRLTTEFLQAGGELDEAGLTDIREQLGKHMASILDVLHNGWMDNMMGQVESEDEEFSDEEVSDDESEESEEKESDDEESEEKDEDESEEKESDDEESEEKDEDESEEKDDDKDDDDNDNGFPFKEAHLNEGYDYSSTSVSDAAADMRKNLNKILFGNKK